MQDSMYKFAIPTFIHMLKNLEAILEKAAAHAAAKNIEPSALLNCRLFPDMFSMLRQVQIASDGAKAGAARLCGMEPPVFEDNETSFAELIARLRKTVAYLETFKPGQFNGAENRTVTWKARGGERSMQGMVYLNNYILPNLYFHITTAYGILRHCGVEVGKKDYLGKV